MEGRRVLSAQSFSSACTVLMLDVAIGNGILLGITQCRLGPAHRALRGILAREAGDAAQAAALLQDHPGEVLRAMQQEMEEVQLLWRRLLAWAAVVAPPPKVEANIWQWGVLLSALLRREAEGSPAGDVPLERVIGVNAHGMVAEWHHSSHVFRDVLHASVHRGLGAWDREAASALGGRSIAGSLLVTAASNWFMCDLSRRIGSFEPVTVDELLMVVEPIAREVGLRDDVRWPPVPSALQRVQMKATAGMIAR